MRKLGIGSALVVTILLSAALTGVQYLGYRLLGLPFSPADLYDWLLRTGWGLWVSLVGSVTTFFVGRGQTPAAASATGETILSLSLFLMLAIVAGIVFYLFVGRRRALPDGIDGVTIGAVFGAPMLLVSLFAGRSLVVDPLFIIIWILGLFLAWGVVLSYSFRRLMQPVAVPAPVLASSDDPNAAPTVVDPNTAANLDRRKFLFQLGASTAAITAISATAGVLLAKDAGEKHAVRPFPIADAAFLADQSALLGNFRRFAIVSFRPDSPENSEVVALGAEYPDRNYVSVWLGEGSPIVIYENLEAVLTAYSTDETETTVFWLDG